MERHAIVMRMRSGMQQEYKRRHDDLWPQMHELLRKAGFRNYSIWNAGDMLFQYFEIEDYGRALSILADSEVKKRWDEYMSDIIDEENAVEMKEMFCFQVDQ
jgi:L-rhamnose mutarotase